MLTSILLAEPPFWQQGAGNESVNCSNLSLARVDVNTELEQIALVQRISYNYVTPLLCTFGLVLNPLVILVLSQKVYKSPSFILMRAIAYSDLSSAVFAFGIGCLHCTVTLCPATPMGHARMVYLVYIGFPFVWMAETMQIWLAVVLSIERLTAMRETTQPGCDQNRLITRRAAYMITGGLLIVTFCIHIPLFFEAVITNCNMKVLTAFGASYGYSIYLWILVAITRYVPGVFVSVINIVLMHDIWRSLQRSKKINIIWSVAARRETWKRRITAMLVGVILTYLFCHLPDAILYRPSFERIFSEYDEYSYEIAVAVSNALVVMSYSLDFVVYCAFNQYFRTDVVAFVVHPWRKRSTKVGPSQVDPYLLGTTHTSGTGHGKLSTHQISHDPPSPTSCRKIALTY